MAQISSISNGEAMSSVRTKLNDVITNVNLLDPTDWVDYSATSTIVGWSSRTITIIKYRILGKQMFVQVRIDGTSNSTSLTFTLPNNSIDTVYAHHRYINNGAVGTALQTGRILGGANLFSAWTSTNAGTWTASGTKTIELQFFFEIA